MFLSNKVLSEKNLVRGSKRLKLYQILKNFQPCQKYFDMRERRKMQEILATENKLAKIFQFSERKVREYFKAARVSPGKYNFIQAVEIFVEKNSGKDEAAELKRAEKDLKEFKLKILKKEYHSEKDVIKIVSDMNYRIKYKLITIPKKVSILILNKSNQLEVEKILKDEINNVLEELTEYSYQEEQEIGEIDG